MHGSMARNSKLQPLCRRGEPSALVMRARSSLPPFPPHTDRDQGQAAPPHPLPGSDRLDIQTTSFSVASMDVPLCDLWLRVGAAAPALYCHQVG